MDTTRKFKRNIMTGEEIDRSLDQIAAEALTAYSNLSNVAVIGVRTNGVPLARRLIDKIEAVSEKRLELGMLDINLYMDDWRAVAERPIVHTTEIPFSLKDRDILLIDDILASGRTIQAAMEALLDGGRPRSIWLAILIDVGRRRFPIQPDYCGLRVPVSDDEILVVALKGKPDDKQPEGVVVYSRKEGEQGFKGLQR